MKSPDSDPRWEALVRQAREDAGPPVDLPALLRAVRQAPLTVAPSWSAEFAALCGSPRRIGLCLGSAAAFTVVATWQAWETSSLLPWAEFYFATGGMP